MAKAAAASWLWQRQGKLVTLIAQREGVLTAADVARWLRMSPGTVTRWARLHEDSQGAEGLPGFKAMGQWRFHAAEVDAWLERCSEKPRVRRPGEVQPIRGEKALTPRV